MNRLTRKFDNGHTDYCFNCDEEIRYSWEKTNVVDKSLNKLGQLEDIEEELGIDLTVLFKALKNGFWWKKENDIIHTPVFSYKELHVCSMGYILEFDDDRLKDFYIKLNDYGKTWSLTKEELENDK